MGEDVLDKLGEILEDMQDDVGEQAELVDERLDDIPDSYSMPDLEDMTLHEAKQFRLGIVFLDINSFTGYTQSHPPRDVLFMLNVFIPKVMDLVRGLDGAFEKNTGDGVLTYFGAGEDDDVVADSVLAYFFGVQLLLHLAVNPVLENYDVEPISISGGAGLGDTHISRIGIHGMNRRTAVSVTANVAAKLEDKADTNQYYVDQGIAEYASDDGIGSLLEQAGTLAGYKWGNAVTGWTDPAEYYEFPDLGGTIAEELR